ncbi:MAG: hypothetical protein Q8N10_00280 [Phenylobacterium sp.]|uniref:hypothetical protein n=1 Tax=Phenylobacterium sp. TaxID=1871053 RepID=UPI0027254732|nr:hypothetical protein [Phenylobacterium sp.]MDO8911454.1 hypothetical protein [Phenylobacterium sp.]MDP2011506.1 hypothetical protein [Phenylobacterium sp.]MDP3098914.1 hypothetical protein [Phenylobacterium sp.]MDP3868822.1 hypothetical protein [Phenylobacterium sp.]
MELKPRMNESGGIAVGVTASERSSRSAANVVVRGPVLMTHRNMTAVSRGGAIPGRLGGSAYFAGAAKSTLVKN